MGVRPTSCLVLESTLRKGVSVDKDDRTYVKARVLFESGHTEYVEMDYKSKYPRVLSGIHNEVSKLLGVDPVVYSKPYHILEAIVYETPDKKDIGLDHCKGTPEYLLMLALKSKDIWMLYDLSRGRYYNYGHMMIFLRALSKLGWVRFSSMNEVMWTGG